MVHCITPWFHAGQTSLMVHLWCITYGLWLVLWFIMSVRGLSWETLLSDMDLQFPNHDPSVDLRWMGGSFGDHLWSISSRIFINCNTRLFPINMIYKTLFLIQTSPRHTQTQSETHRKYHKITVYLHPQVKLFVCHEATH